MPQQKVMNRWIVVIGALGIQLCLGSLYAWSIFVNPLKHQYGYTTTQAQAIFSTTLAVFAFAMIFAGRLQDKFGPRFTAITGSILFAAGYFLSGFTNGSFTGLLCTIGILAGAGIGFGYVSPIAALVKWFPDKRGLMTGVAVAGFGAGALVFARAANHFIMTTGVMSAFFNLGTIFFAVCIPSSFILCNPPEKWLPQGWSPKRKKNTPAFQDFTWREMICTKQFWMLWFMFITGASAGLMVIGNLKPFGVHNGLAILEASSAVGILAIFNGAGRIAWGMAYDKSGRVMSMSLMFFLQGIMMIALIKMGGTPMSLAIAAALIGFNFGGVFTMFPSSTADFFGTKFIGVNYAFVYTAYGIAGIIGPMLGGRIFDMTGSYLYAFVPAGIMCIVASMIALLTRHPLEPDTNTEPEEIYSVCCQSDSSVRA
ncbi:MAG: OFA family MFS transporter [Candidatus Auribacterota bacterium]|jgi:OFA family oxalate/formate antiporter-like MFS transporter|nr:OFA family MFS transporter [Candidatus Auribacterota bacterium]